MFGDVLHFSRDSNKLVYYFSILLFIFTVIISSLQTFVSMKMVNKIFQACCLLLIFIIVTYGACKSSVKHLNLVYYCCIILPKSFGLNANHWIHNNKRAGASLSVLGRLDFAKFHLLLQIFKNCLLSVQVAWIMVGLSITLVANKGINSTGAIVQLSQPVTRTLKKCYSSWTLQITIYPSISYICNVFSRVKMYFCPQLNCIHTEWCHIMQRFLALIAFLCWFAIKQSI